MKLPLIAICLTLSVCLSLRADDSVVSSTDNLIQPPKVAASPESSFPHEASDLKPDPAAVWGSLDNGLRYVILPHRGQPGRASLRLYINIGSAVENDDQQGMAHFLEHMAFNGTRNFPAGESLKYFQRLGMAFVAHTNAATSLDSTVYKLELPRVEDELTKQSLTFFRDVLDGMNLDEREIEQERRVVLSEMLARNSANYRSTVAGLQFALPDSNYSRRMPIGTTECIRGMSRKQFIDFYETWYTPSRATIVAAGDLNADSMRQLIEEHFQDAKARRGETSNPSFGEIATGHGVVARLHTEKEASATTISLSINRPHVADADTAKRQRKELVRALANLMLSTRFEKLAGAPGACIQNGAASFSSSFGFVDQTSAAVVCESKQWAAALRLVEQEVRRAAKYGFTDDEFARAKAAAAAYAQSEADGAETRQPAELADGIVESLHDKHVFTHPSDDVSLLKNMLTDLAKEECHEAFRQSWDSPDVRVFVQGNLELDGDSAKKILSVYGFSRLIPVSPPAGETSIQFAYTDFGPAGKIVSRRQHDDLGIVQAVFANHVRVNVKQTPFEINGVRVLVSVGGGLLQAPIDKPGLAQFTNAVFMTGGLQAHSLDEVNRIVSSKHVGLQFAVADDSFQLGGRCAPAELQTQLQLTAAFVAAPGYRAEAAIQQQKFYDGFYNQLEHTPEGIVERDIKQFMRAGDVRFGFPDRETMRKLTMEDVKAWLETPLRDGYLEVAIVGNVDPDKALELVAKTFGALPTRAAAAPAFKDERKVTFPAGTKTKEFTFTSDNARAVAVVCWPTDDGADVARARRLGVLSEVLADRLRLKVREELGATYTPVCNSFTSDVFPGYGFIGAQVMVDSKELSNISGLIAAIGGELASGSISDDEFGRAMKPILSGVQESVRGNDYWLNVLNNCQRRPELLEYARSRTADNAAIQKTEIESLAKQYLSADRATIISAKPAGAGTK